MIFVLSVFILLILAVIGLYAAYVMAFAPPRREPDPRHVSSSEQYQAVKEGILALVDGIESCPYEEVSIVSHDGLRLSGKLYLTDPSAPIVLGLHGFRSCTSRDCAGIFKVAHSRGMNLLLPDMRGHGKSQGRFISLGILERYDCRRWVDYILERFGKDTKILLCGCSMGAATVMMSAELQPEQVKGLICDCGYSSVKGIFMAVAKQMDLPPRLSYQLLRLTARIFGRFDTEESSSISSLSKSKIPALFVHGTDDRYVPCSMVYENFQACASDNKRLLTVPGAGHGLSFLVDEPAYTQALLSFFNDLGL